MAMKNDAKFGDGLTCCLKIDIRNLMRALESLKILHFNGHFWSKYIMFDLKKYRGIVFDSTEDWCKIWKKTDLCFQKWHEEFGKFSQTEK